MYISLFTVATHVNYISEFLELFEANAYVTLFFDITLLSCLDASCVCDALKFCSLIRGLLGTFHRDFRT